jgi:hypothetical protein
VDFFVGIDERIFINFFVRFPGGIGREKGEREAE